jgi:hypothetical protein
MVSTLARFEFSGLLPVGTPKTLVNAATFYNEEALHRIVDAYQSIGKCAGVFIRTRRSVMRRVEACTFSALIINVPF